MNLPDSLTRVRPTSADEYGNPSASWAGAAELTVKGFLTGDKAYLAAGTDVLFGDRIRYGPKTFDVVAVKELRSPRRTILLLASLRRTDVAA